MKIQQTKIIAVCLVLFFTRVNTALAQNTAFNYQGAGWRGQSGERYPACLAIAKTASYPTKKFEVRSLDGTATVQAP